MFGAQLAQNARLPGDTVTFNNVYPPRSAIFDRPFMRRMIYTDDTKTLTARSTCIHPLLFRAGELDALNKGLLREEECNDNRHGKNNRGSHQLIPDHGALTLKVL